MRKFTPPILWEMNINDHGLKKGAGYNFQQDEAKLASAPWKIVSGPFFSVTEKRPRGPFFCDWSG
jgi:hypothetical protein